MITLVFLLRSHFGHVKRVDLCDTETAVLDLGITDHNLVVIGLTCDNISIPDNSAVGPKIIRTDLFHRHITGVD